MEDREKGKGRERGERERKRGRREREKEREEGRRGREEEGETELGRGKERINKLMFTSFSVIFSAMTCSTPVRAKTSTQWPQLA